MEATELTEEESNRLLHEEFPEPALKGLSLKNFKKLGFFLAHSKYYKLNDSQKHLELQVLCLSKEGGEIIYKLDYQNLRRSDEKGLQGGKFIRLKESIRDQFLRVAYDDGFVINLEKVAKEVGFIFL